MRPNSRLLRRSSALCATVLAATVITSVHALPAYAAGEKIMMVNQTDGALQLINRQSGWSSAGWSKSLSKGTWGKLTEAKFRYYNEKKTAAGKVTAVSGDGGHVGLIKPSGALLWDYEIGGSPHSIEVLPNGRIAVADPAGGGSVKLIGAGSAKPLSKVSATVALSKAHGVTWDASNNLLWMIGDTQARAYKITGSKAAPTFGTKVHVFSLPNPSSAGHDLYQSKVNANILLFSEYRVGTIAKDPAYGQSPVNAFSSGAWANISRAKSFSNWGDGKYIVCQGLKDVEFCTNNRAKVLNNNGSVAFDVGQGGKQYYKARPFYWIGW